MSLKRRKKTDGTCPNCSSVALSPASEQPEHPSRDALLCGDCGEYCILFKQRGIIYPLSEPDDPLSSPVIGR